jgi:hypothetical protein
MDLEKAIKGQPSQLIKHIQIQIQNPHSISQNNKENHPFTLKWPPLLLPSLDFFSSSRFPLG